MFGSNLRQIRKQKQMSQAMLANKIGKAQQTISWYESGQVYPSLKVVENIAQALDVSVEQLIAQNKKGASKYMGRPSKFKREQVSEMIGLMKEQTVIVKEKTKMKISDEEMRSILCAAGYDVNIRYVERMRQAYGISARNKEKFFDDDVAKIHIIIKKYISDNGSNESSWKMTVSDATMAGILKEAGYDVNAKYVERTRRSLGIEPLGKRGGAGPGAARSPSNNSGLGYALVMANHFRDTYRLSDHRCPSGALSGQSGEDKYTPGFGYHTTDLETAKKRKDARLARLAQKTGNKNSTARNNYTVTPADANVNDIERLFTEEVERSSSLYGRTGTQGGKQNTRTAQAYSSL